MILVICNSTKLSHFVFFSHTGLFCVLILDIRLFTQVFFCRCAAQRFSSRRRFRSKVFSVFVWFPGLSALGPFAMVVFNGLNFTSTGGFAANLWKALGCSCFSTVIEADRKCSFRMKVLSVLLHSKRLDHYRCAHHRNVTSKTICMLCRLSMFRLVRLQCRTKVKSEPFVYTPLWAEDTKELVFKQYGILLMGVSVIRG